MMLGNNTLNPITTRNIKGGKEYRITNSYGLPRALGRYVDGVFKTSRDKYKHYSWRYDAYGMNWLLLTKYLTPDTAIIITERDGVKKRQLISTVQDWLEKGVVDSLGGYDKQVFLKL